MYKIYYLVSYETSWYYIGMTKNSVKTRFNSHVYMAKSGAKSPLYSCMRKYKFIPVIKQDNLTHEEACEFEIKLIKEARDLGHKILNLAEGGEGGYVVPDDKREAWLSALKLKRQGRKPALGMKHSNENKKLFSEVSRKYWDSQETYSKDIAKLSFKEAKALHGISKTHYYRLKRSLNSEQ